MKTDKSRGAQPSACSSDVGQERSTCHRCWRWMVYKSSFLSDKTVNADYSILFSPIPKAVSLNLDPTASTPARSHPHFHTVSTSSPRPDRTSPACFALRFRPHPSRADFAHNPLATFLCLWGKRFSSPQNSIASFLSLLGEEIFVPPKVCKYFITFSKSSRKWQIKNKKTISAFGGATGRYLYHHRPPVFRVVYSFLKDASSQHVLRWTAQPPR